VLAVQQSLPAVQQSLPAVQANTDIKKYKELVLTMF